MYRCAGHPPNVPHTQLVWQYDENGGTLYLLPICKISIAEMHAFLCAAPTAVMCKHTWNALACSPSRLLGSVVSNASYSETDTDAKAHEVISMEETFRQEITEIVKKRR